jgi:predicted RNase H-like HicB family nuclease
MEFMGKLGFFKKENKKTFRDKELCFNNEWKIDRNFNTGKMKYMKKIIQVKIYKGEKYYVAECIDLRVVTQGKTLDEVIKNIKEEISLHLEGEDLKKWDILPDFSVLINLELESLHTKT